MRRTSRNAIGHFPFRESDRRARPSRRRKFRQFERCALTRSARGVGERRRGAGAANICAQKSMAFLPQDLGEAASRHGHSTGRRSAQRPARTPGPMYRSVRARLGIGPRWRIRTPIESEPRRGLSITGNDKAANVVRKFRRRTIRALCQGDTVCLILVVTAFHDFAARPEIRLPRARQLPRGDPHHRIGNAQKQQLFGVLQETSSFRNRASRTSYPARRNSAATKRASARWIHASG